MKEYVEPVVQQSWVITMTPEMSAAASVTEGSHVRTQIVW
jgi:hypothetical protein